MNKVILCSFVFLSGCATLGTTTDKTFEQSYIEKTDVARVCIENTLVAILGLPVNGFYAFHDLCNKTN